MEPLTGVLKLHVSFGQRASLLSVNTEILAYNVLFDFVNSYTTS